MVLIALRYHICAVDIVSGSIAGLNRGCEFVYLRILRRRKGVILRDVVLPLLGFYRVLDVWSFTKPSSTLPTLYQPLPTLQVLVPDAYGIRTCSTHVRGALFLGARARFTQDRAPFHRYAAPEERHSVRKDGGIQMYPHKELKQDFSENLYLYLC